RGLVGAQRLGGRHLFPSDAVAPGFALPCLVRHRVPMAQPGDPPGSPSWQAARRGDILRMDELQRPFLAPPNDGSIRRGTAPRRLADPDVAVGELLGLPDR